MPTALLRRAYSILLIGAIVLTYLLLAPDTSAQTPGVSQQSERAAVTNDQVSFCASGTYGCATGDLVAVSAGQSTTCYFQNNTPNMGACRNTQTTFKNLGRACLGCQNVRLYWGLNYTGAWACITPGYSWIRAGNGNHAPFTFNFGSGLSGRGQSIFYNTSAGFWTGSCS